MSKLRLSVLSLFILILLNLFLTYKLYNKNKLRVVIVGPSPCIENMNLGSLIDSYDIVCRVNTSFTAALHNPKDYGTRCDVLFMTCNDFVNKYVLENFDSFPKHTQFIAAPVSNSKQFLRGYLNKQDTKLIQNKTNLKWIEYDNGTRNWNNTGLISCVEILNYWPNVEELLIVGFSFYNENKRYANNVPIDKGPTGADHNQQKEKRFFKENILNHPKAHIHETTLYHLNK